VQAALKGATKDVLRNYLERCAADAIKSGDPEIYDDLIEAIYKFVKWCLVVPAPDALPVMGTKVFSLSRSESMMNRKLIGASVALVPLIAIGGLVAANSQVQPSAEQAQVSSQGYLCPVTGEELPCPKCCVLNQNNTESK
jgi:hypothetical protein